MRNSMNKALIAFVLGAISLLNTLFGIDAFGEYTMEIIGAILAILFPVAVWWVPNE